MPLLDLSSSASYAFRPTLKSLRSLPNSLLPKATPPLPLGAPLDENVNGDGPPYSEP